MSKPDLTTVAALNDACRENPETVFVFSKKAALKGEAFMNEAIQGIRSYDSFHNLSRMNDRSVGVLRVGRCQVLWFFVYTNFALDYRLVDPADTESTMRCITVDITVDH